MLQSSVLLLTPGHLGAGDVLKWDADWEWKQVGRLAGTAGPQRHPAVDMETNAWEVRANQAGSNIGLWVQTQTQPWFCTTRECGRFWAAVSASHPGESKRDYLSQKISQC